MTSRVMCRDALVFAAAAAVAAADDCDDAANGIVPSDELTISSDHDSRKVSPRTQ